MLIFVIAVLFTLAFVSRGENSKKIGLVYPVEFLPQYSEIVTNLTLDKLTCFQHGEPRSPSLFQVASCIIPYLSFSICDALWGSKSVVIGYLGDLELFKVSDLRLKSDDDFRFQSRPLNATRWITLTYDISLKEDVWMKEIIQVPSETIYICGRSTNTAEGSSYFTWSIRSTYLRERDRRQAFEKIGYHIVLLFATASEWLLPYFFSLLIAILSYLHGLKVIMILLVISSITLCLSPIMLLKKYRNLASLYLNYFFNRNQALEAKLLLKKKRPIFQAFYFSCLLLCAGCGASYMLYYYDLLHREHRNVFAKVTISIASGWFTFFFCRSFEKILSDWSWMLMVAGLQTLLEAHFNPNVNNKLVLVVSFLSFFIVFLTRRLWQLTSPGYIYPKPVVKNVNLRNGFHK
jgi:hypothetical protein